MIPLALPSTFWVVVIIVTAGVLFITWPKKAWWRRHWPRKPKP